MSNAGRNIATTAFMLVGVLLTGGCVEPCPDTVVPLDRIVQRYNANANAVERLWARATLSVTLDVPDAPPFTWQSGSPTCLLLLKKGRDKLGPHDFVLIGRETAAVELFRIGTSTEQRLHYFWYRFGDSGGAWAAPHEGAGGPGRSALPVDPAQLLSVLTVCALPDDPTKLPAVAVGMQNTPGDCAYVVTLIDRQPVTNRILLKREVLFRWDKDEPCRPYKVNLFDAAGRRVMTARLRDYKPIDVSDLDDPPDEPPLMPTDIEMTFHPVGGVKTAVKRIHLVLSEMTVEDKWERTACDFKPPDGIRKVHVDGGLVTPAATRPVEGESK